MMKNESESGASAEQNLDEWAAQMLKRIGWHESNRKQIEMYANMPIAKKVAQMLRFRRRQVQVLKNRLQQEHPGSSQIEIARMVQKHLALLQEA